ncbi:MAG: 50S ribosomal protein L1 [Thermoplasmata archaeon]
MVNEDVLKNVKTLLETSKKRNFKESIELAINLKDIDMSNPKNRIEEEIQLPNGRGRGVKVLVFGSSELAAKAKGVADRVIQPNELNEIAGNKKSVKKLANEYDFLVAEAPLMLAIGKQMGSVLGPRGKMPKPIPLGADPKSIVESLRTSVRMRTKDKTTFHIPVGTREIPPEKIAENIEVVMKRLENRLERGKMNIKSVYVKTTMGTPIKLF